MKKNVAIICFLSISLLSFAQNDYKRNTIKLNFFGFFFGDGSLGYERVLNTKNSLQTNYAFGRANSKGFQYNLNALLLGHRYYFKGNVNKGFFVNSEVGLSAVTADDKIKKETSTSYIWRLYGGYKRTFPKGFSLETGLGADGLGTKFKDTRYDGFFVPLYPYATICVGYAF